MNLEENVFPVMLHAHDHTQGEKLEDEIIEIATVLREKADEMVAETGSINLEVVQPMMDELKVLKARYR